MNSRAALIKSGFFCHSLICSQRSLFPDFMAFLLSISTLKESLIYKDYVHNPRKEGVVW